MMAGRDSLADGGVHGVRGTKRRARRLFLTYDGNRSCMEAPGRHRSSQFLPLELR